MYCIKCGASHSHHHLYCSTCGTPVQPTSEQATVQPFSKENKIRPKRHFPWLKTLSFIFLALAGIWIGLNSFKDDFSELAFAQLEAFENQQFTESYYKYMSQEYQGKHSLKEFLYFLKANKELLEPSHVIFTQTQKANQQGLLTGLLTTKSNKQMPLQYLFKKEAGTWKIHDILIEQDLEEVAELPPDFSITPKRAEVIQEGSSQKDNEVNPNSLVRQFLALLRKKQYNEAYQLMSSDFQEKTSLEAFQAKIESTAIFNRFEYLEFLDQKVSENQATLSVLLQEDSVSQPLNLILKKIKKQWFIEQIELKPTVAVQETKKPTSFDFTPLFTVVERQFQAIKDKQIEQAYQNFTSVEFRKKISPDTFKSFIQDHPILTSYKKINFNEVGFNNNTAHLQGWLTGANGERFILMVEMIQEAHTWKVQFLNIEPPPAATAPGEHTRSADSPPSEEIDPNLPIDHNETFFARFEIGTVVTPEGRVARHQSVFAAEKEELHIDLYLEKAKKGTQVYLTLKSLDSGGVIPPVSTTIQQDGNAVVSYAFAAPESGWPQGDYEIFARASNGTNQTYRFKIAGARSDETEPNEHVRPQRP